MNDTNVSEIDYATLDIEHLDVSLVAETQIVEFISRKRLSLSRMVNEILAAQDFETRSHVHEDECTEISCCPGKGRLGFVFPSISVLVKSDIEPADPDTKELKAFSLRSGTPYGLFVSWAGFTDSAREEEGQLFQQAIFWDIRQIVEMLKANYERLSTDFKSDLPLKKIWVLQETGLG
jgi:restriction system protein